MEDNHIELPVNGIDVGGKEYTSVIFLRWDENQGKAVVTSMPDILKYALRSDSKFDMMIQKAFRKAVTSFPGCYAEFVKQSRKQRRRERHYFLTHGKHGLKRPRQPRK